MGKKIKNFGKFKFMIAYKNSNKSYIYVGVKHKETNISIGASIGTRGLESHIAHTEGKRQIKFKHNHTFDKNSVKFRNMNSYLKKYF